MKAGVNKINDTHSKIGNVEKLFIVFLGIDGSGKSSLISALRESLSYPLTKVYHFSPGKSQYIGTSPAVTTPHAKRPWPAPLSCLKLVYYLLRYTVGHRLIIRPLLAKKYFILFDRYYHDILVDPIRYRYGGPAFLARLVARFIPKPDLFIFLDLPAEVAHDRKPEVPLEEARRLRRRYLELARSMPNAYVVDASKPLDEVVRDVERIILDYMSERTKKKLLGMKLGPKK